MGGLLFWTYLALAVTPQLLSLLSLAGRLKRTAKGLKEEWRKTKKVTSSRSEGRKEKTWKQRDKMSKIMRAKLVKFLFKRLVVLRCTEVV